MAFLLVFLAFSIAGMKKKTSKATNKTPNNMAGEEHQNTETQY